MENVKNTVTASPTEQREALEKFKSLLKVTDCKWCRLDRKDEVSLLNQPVQHYPHSGGWNVPGFADKQWLYLSCPTCGYQWSFSKLGVPREEETV